MEFIDLKTQRDLLREKIDANIEKVINHAGFVNGPEVAQLEELITNYTGARYAVGCASGTEALQIALMALDCQPGEEVITTPFTFAATAEVILLLGLIPVFVDIDPLTYQIDHNKISDAITTKTKAIITVSLYGQCSEMDLINKIAEDHNIAVIEDAAQSFGATYKGKKSCNLSDIGCTSFFPSKPLGCYGDGGMMTTSDEKIANKLKMIRNHGQSKRYTHAVVGLNSRLDTIQAAILLAKMTIFDQEVKARQRIGQRYNELLKNYAQLPKLMDHNTHVYAQYTVEVDNREQIIAKLRDQGIPTAVHYPIGLHLQPVMQKYNFDKGTFPFTESASQRVMSLPMHPYLSEKAQDEIVTKFKNSL